jgi:hypothetical protein
VGSITKDANWERLEVMRYIITLTVLGLFSLLMANETIYNLQFVLDNPQVYPNTKESYDLYSLLGTLYQLAGFACLAVASSLVVIKVRQESK